MSFRDELYRTADELRGIATEGARYADNDYDRRLRAGDQCSTGCSHRAAVARRGDGGIQAEPRPSRTDAYSLSSGKTTASGLCPAARLKSARRGRSRPNGSSAKKQAWSELPRSCSACSTLESEAAVPSITSTPAYGSSRSPTSKPRSPARKRLTWASSRSTTCLRSCRRDTLVRYRWLSSSPWRYAGAVFRPDDLIPVTRLSWPAVVD